MPRLSSNDTLALYTPFSRFKASRAVVGQLPHVIFEMCSRTVAVSGVWAAMPRFCRLAPRIPPPHSGHKKAAPMRPAATTSPAFADTNMLNLLRDESASRTSPKSTPGRSRGNSRSEEHTSELQSPCNLVCRLLLEKKKRNCYRDVYINTR